MKILIIVITLTLLLFSQKIDLLVVDKNAKFNKYIIKNLEDNIANIEIQEIKNISSYIDLLSQDDKLRLGLIPNEALLYYRSHKDRNLNDKIKLLIPLYDKFIYIFVLKNSTINSIKDLNKKTISIGKEYSSSWFVGKVLKKENNISWIEKNDEIDSEEMLINIAKKFGNGEIDAFIYVGKDDNKTNLIEKYFPKSMEKHLRLLQVKSKNFKTKKFKKSEHLWLDSKFKEILFTKELIVVHNFFYIRGETSYVNKKYEKNINTIRRVGAKIIKRNLKIKTRDFHGVTWRKWLMGNLIQTNRI